MKNKYSWAKKEQKAREKGHKLRFFPPEQYYKNNLN